ncbi:hypothetical protein ACEE21_15360 [Clostridium baratii]
MSNEGRKREKVVTRNIFPDLLRVFKVLLIGFLIYFAVFTLVGEVVPFVGGYSFYTCNRSYLEYGYSRGDTLVLKEGDSKGKYVLVKNGESSYSIEPNVGESNRGTIVYSFNIYNRIIDTYKWIINTIKGLF